MVLTKEPFDWNVIVLGFWNPAILTPAGISRRLFENPPNIPLQVEVPLDGLTPHRVKQNGVVVIADTSRLLVQPEVSNYETLRTAMEVCIKAIRNLPETPFSAAGFNLRFKLGNVPAEFIAAVNPEVDGLLSEKGYIIRSRTMKRSLSFKAGDLNLSIIQNPNEELKLEYNFHRQSAIPAELIEWLATSKEEIEAEAEKILKIVEPVLQESAS